MTVGRRCNRVSLLFSCLLCACMPPAYAHQRATFMRGLLQRIIRIEYRFSLGKQVPTLVASQAYKTVKVPELAFVDKTISVPTLIKVSLCAPATGIQMSPRLSTSGVSSRRGMIASAPQPSISWSFFRSARNSVFCLPCSFVRFCNCNSKGPEADHDEGAGHRQEGGRLRLQGEAHACGDRRAHV